MCQAVRSSPGTRTAGQLSTGGQKLSMIAGMEQKKGRFLTPVLIYLNLFVTFPTLYTWYMSLTDYGLTGAKFVGLANFRLIFRDSTFQQALLHTFLLVVGAVAIEFLVGMLVALLLNRKFYGKPFLYWVVLLPLILAPVVVGLTFRILYDPTLGLINYLIRVVGLAWALMAHEFPHRARVDHPDRYMGVVAVHGAPALVRPAVRSPQGTGVRQGRRGGSVQSVSGSSRFR